MSVQVGESNRGSYLGGCEEGDGAQEYRIGAGIKDMSSVVRRDNTSAGDEGDLYPECAHPSEPLQKEREERRAREPAGEPGESPRNR